MIRAAIYTDSTRKKWKARQEWRDISPAVSGSRSARLLSAVVLDESGDSPGAPCRLRAARFNHNDHFYSGSLAEHTPRGRIRKRRMAACSSPRSNRCSTFERFLKPPRSALTGITTLSKFDRYTVDRNCQRRTSGKGFTASIGSSCRTHDSPPLTEADGGFFVSSLAANDYMTFSSTRTCCRWATPRRPSWRPNE